MQKIEERLKVRRFQVVIQEGKNEEAVMMHLIPRMHGDGKTKMEEMPLKDFQWIENEAKTLAEYFKEK